MISTISKLKRQKIHSQASSIALSEQTRQRYLYLLSSTNLPFGWWTLTNRRPTSSLIELLFPELKAHYRLMLDSKSFLHVFSNGTIAWTRTTDGLFANRLTVCSLLPTRVQWYKSKSKQDSIWQFSLMSEPPRRHFIP